MPSLGRALQTRRRRGQSSIEFVFLLGVGMAIFLAFFIMIQQNVLSATAAHQAERLREIKNIVLAEFDIAQSTLPGYSRTFSIPPAIEGDNYSIALYDAEELVLNYNSIEIVTFLTFNVTGNVSKGQNTITKNASGIFVRSGT